MTPTLLPLLLALTPPPTSGEVQLGWSAPAGCPSTAEILEDIAELTGRPLREGPPRLVVSATVTASPWRARFAARSAAGHSDRTLAGESCAALARAAAVIVSIALADARRTPGEPAPSWTWPEPSRRPQAAVLTLTPIGTRWPTVVRPWVSTSLLAGVAPTPSASLAAGADLTRARLRLRFGVYGRPEVTQRAEGRTVDYGGLGGRVEGCPVWARRSWELEACAGVEAGAWWVRDRASGTSTPNPWLAPTAGAGGRVRLAGPLWLDLRAALGFPLSRSSIRVSTRPNRPDLDRIIFRPAAVHPRFEIGLSGHFR